MEKIMNYYIGIDLGTANCLVYLKDTPINILIRCSWAVELWNAVCDAFRTVSADKRRYYFYKIFNFFLVQEF